MNKEAVHNACRNLVEQKFNSILDEMHELNHGLANDTKSSAGDKFETSREMAQIELNKLQSALEKHKKQLEALDSIKRQNKSNKVLSGSLVETNHMTFYISISLGKIIYNFREIMVISTEAPIYGLMQNLGVGDCFQLNEKNYEIYRIL